MEWCGVRGALWAPREEKKDKEVLVAEHLIESAGFSEEDARSLAQEITKILNSP
jgi:hypothetical protein